MRSGPVVGGTPSTSMAAVTEGWRHGTYFAVVMRNLQDDLHEAHADRELGHVLAAACKLNVLARNAYNTHYIHSELGEGCEVYLNAHGGRKPNGKDHPWLSKLTKLATPFAADHSKVVLSVSDSMAVSQSRATLPSGAPDTGQAVAVLYAAGYGVTANASIAWLLDRLGVPDLYVQRALRRNEVIVHFGAGKNGWDQSLDRLVMTTGVRTCKVYAYIYIP